MKPASRLLLGTASATALIALVSIPDFSHGPEAPSESARLEQTNSPLPSAAPGSVSTPSASKPSLPDPDQIGSCPKDHSPVLRRGLDSSGQPTWWHADGSMTMRIKQGYTTPDGERRQIARIVLIRPAKALPDPAK